MRKILILTPIFLAFSLLACTEESNDKDTQQPQSQEEVTPSLIVTPTSQEFNESAATASKRYLVSLNSVPKSDVTIVATVSDPGQFSLMATSTVLKPENATTGFAFYGSAIDDGELDGNQSVTITFTATSSDASWNGIQATAEAICIDDGTLPATDYIINRTGNPITSESGDSYQISIALSSVPSSDVSIQIVSSDESEGKVSPSTITFTASNYSVPQTITITGQDDSELDGDIEYTVTLTAQSADSRYAGEEITLHLANRDNEIKPDPIPDPPVPPEPQPVNGTHIRLMAANITSGSDESYDAPESQRIFMAVKPDIVMLQEFKILKGTETSFEASKEKFDAFVSNVFGPEYHYFRGTIIADKVNFDEVSSSAKPNGIISRYPILESGEWQSQYEKTTTKDGTYYIDSYYDRQWTWSVIDIPGDRDLLAVSVHLHTNNHAKEFNPLSAKIAEKQKEGNYYVVIGGDFNTKEGADGREAVLTSTALMDIFYAQKDKWPVDQKGSSKTNNKRGSPLDWLMFSHDLEKLATPTEIGTHTGDKAYPNGHVFDSRVYDEVGEISAVPPVKAGDSGNTNMQHMPVIRDIIIPDE